MNRTAATNFFKALWGFGVLFFGMSIYVQFNDPDPFLWSAVYGVVCLMCVAALFDRLSARIVGMAVIPYLLGALWLSPDLLKTSTQAFTTMGMQNLEHELVREAWGMVICVTWVIGLWLYTRRYTPLIKSLTVNREYA